MTTYPAAVKFLVLIDRFRAGDMAAGQFTDQYMLLWKSCRDDDELELSQLNNACDDALDRIFTASDCLSEEVTARHELTPDQLLDFVRLLTADLNELR